MMSNDVFNFLSGKRVRVHMIVETGAKMGLLTLLAGIAGEALSMWGLISCLTDLNYLTAANLNGARRIVAFQNISRQAYRMVVQAIVLTVGLVSLAIPKQPVILLGCFVAISNVIAVSELTDRYRRVQLEHFYDKLDSGKFGRRRTDAALAAVCEELRKRDKEHKS